MEKKENAKIGRPPIEINQKEFEALCGIQCTKEEICIVLSVSQATLSRWCKRTYGKSFEKVYTEKSARGRASLRRMQWQNAEKGNTTMQIWLGKQFLGQKDGQDISVKTEDKPVITVNIPPIAVKEEPQEQENKAPSEG